MHKIIFHILRHGVGYGIFKVGNQSEWRSCKAVLPFRRGFLCSHVNVVLGGKEGL